MLEWNPWWVKKYEFKGVERDIFKEILPWVKRKEIISIIGVRRAGKTTLLYQIIWHLIAHENIKPEHILFIKADDDRVNAENLIARCIDEYKAWKNPTSGFFIFVDEIQEVKNWQRTLKRLYDLEKNLKIFISGSNADILKDELSSLIAGRFSYFEVFPFSFSEFVRARNIQIKDETNLLEKKNVIKNLLINFVEKGSFPEVVLEASEKISEELIRFYFDSIFYRDVIKRKKIRNPAKIESLVKYMLQNVSNLINFSKIAAMLDLSVDSVTEYVKSLEDAYLVFSISLFDFSYKKQIINPKKVYCVDTGMRNIVGFNFSSDIGRLYENIVFVHLRRKGKEVFYWKGKRECDFVVKSGKKLECIEVCYALDKETKEKEVNALLEAMENFRLRKGLIINDNYEAKEVFKRKTIEFIPLWKWLLKEL